MNVTDHEAIKLDMWLRSQRPTDGLAHFHRLGEAATIWPVIRGYVVRYG